MSFSLNSERAVVAITLLLVSVGLFASASHLSDPGTDKAFDPGFFPRIVLGCLIALGALNLVVDLRADTGWNLAGLGRVAIMMTILAIYVVVIPDLGFFAASVVLSLAFLLLLGVRSPLGLAAVAFGVPGALVVLFNHVLKMPLPTSPLFWWI